MNLNHKELIMRMARIQDDTNKQIAEDWKKKRFNFPAAMVAECGEALEHMGYKWWKEQEPNLEQTKLEIVDLLHFLLSLYLMGNDVKSVGQQFVDETGAVEKPTPSNEELIAELVLLAQDHSFFHWNMVRLHAQMEMVEVARLFIGKAALNRFRWKNGYGTTYKKIWDGREDNEHLFELIADLSEDQLTLKHITGLLEERYKTVA